MPKPYKDVPSKENYRLIPLMNVENFSKDISQSNTSIYSKNNIPWSSRVFPRNASLVQYSKSSKSNSSD